MVKTLSGGALIAYGPTLPSAGNTPDGALFYKTDGISGGPQGLYINGFLKDSNTAVFGAQVLQGWVQATSPDLYVLKDGDTMRGALTVPAILRVTENNTTPQRILIGYQGGAALPSVIESAGGVLSIGRGADWGTGGTLTSGLSVAPANGNSGLTWQGVQVWHANNDGHNSTLDADLLDGQQGAFYQNASNMNAGTLAVTRGGTGTTSTTVGGIVFGASASALGTTAAGTAGQVLTSNAAAAPTWVNQSALSVGNATYADSAGLAANATNAANAMFAQAVPWTGITGLGSNSLSSYQTLGSTFVAGAIQSYARSQYFFDFGNTGAKSPLPPAYPLASVSGFDGYFTSDMGQHQVGITVMGTPSSGARGAQLAFNWNFEETMPVGGVKYRVNDDTGTVGEWGPWCTIWDQGNLTKLSQLTNDAGFVTASTGGGSAPVFNSTPQVGSSLYYWGSNDGVNYYQFNMGEQTVTNSTTSQTISIAMDDITNGTFYPTFVSANSSGQQFLTSTTKITFNPGAGHVTATQFNGLATSAKYADLAERYTADAEYAVGTVMVISQDEDSETTASFRRGQRVLGVVSENPAFLMNDGCDGPALALRGRVPVFVTGPVRKGDLLIAEDDGSAVVQLNDQGKEFAQALVTDLRTERRLVECAVL